MDKDLRKFDHAMIDKLGKNAAGKEGSGLGLYISGVLMQKMQGELLCTAASDDPENEFPGLTVTLLIPLS